ncbi:putative 1-phosphatidylinositol 3-phosphate 5-kinase isoform X1 [Selaginella moellendorffii]|uniref:putative 1-phosphatidylinositol 3-phosphate 5-kinase isoform X1 n=1 Tax=Selaginella moellendorffii TaxID=88036 RepID=UPI000D1C78E1|nr:putative 1-phosphatidylinositol 3-phosphate 5-kinase isoform X1 [Selaginella moellendorffii]XP_024518437.1 putative 1-phosphatidylinositol 3-phosphate 5-kinase isoform X1 [Selaginella moellendorffii]XP_024518438.1 putative 1-phosphatidylinositol 3-phosphate 5-kinase isoform X1 [Selaginella moellendorffii]|eukprot:XP_024518436.1 putative 1-phosphatidylinositol 3-phosphate 5-kinase isoform X1 [Selaginella moellendorffii]
MSTVRLILPSDVERKKLTNPRYGPSSTQRRRNTGEAQFCLPPWLSSLLEALQDSDPAIENGPDETECLICSISAAWCILTLPFPVMTRMIGSLSTVKSRPSEDGKWPTQDRRFLLQMVTAEEIRSFSRFASAYVNYISSNRNRTMLVKIYGAFTCFRLCMQVISGDAVNHIVLMQYLKPPGNVVSQYQLKASGSKMEPVYLAGLEYLRFEEIVKRDTQFLQDDSVVDYSLLCFKTENREVVVGVVDFFGRRTLRKSLKLLVERPSWMRLRQALVTPCVYHSLMRSKIDMVFYMFCPRDYFCFW